MAGIKDIARYCNVSISTVSNILNGKSGPSKETREKVLAAAKELNYRPNFMAKNLKQRVTRTIGVITEDLTTFTTPEVVDGVNAFCEENNYQIILGNLRLHKKYAQKYYVTKDYYGQVKNEFFEMQAKQVEGVIYIGGHERILECLPKKVPFPVVAAYGLSGRDEIPSVVIDDEQGGYEATRMLIQNGHTRIGVVAGPSTSFHMKSRLRGHQRALFESNILFDPELLIEGDWEQPSGYAAMEQLLKKDITAVFSMNDMMVIGIDHCLNDHGMKMGEEISVIGYDNREFGICFHPELSTMQLPLEEIGYKAAQIMVSMLKNRTLESNIYSLGCRYIERESIRDIRK